MAILLCIRPSGSETPAAKPQMPSWMTDSPGDAIEFADLTSPTVTAAKVDVFPQTSAGYISKVTCHFNMDPSPTCLMTDSTLMSTRPFQRVFCHATARAVCSPLQKSDVCWSRQE